MLAIGIRIMVGVLSDRGSVSYRLLGEQLNAELSAWLKDVEPTDAFFPIEGCKAIIAPFVSYILSLHWHD